MKETRYSWKSYVFLVISIVVSMAMIFIDLLVSAMGEGVEVILVYTIFIGSLVSIGMAVLTFSDKKEKKKLAVAALLLTIINVGVIAFFLWFGGNYA